MKGNLLHVHSMYSLHDSVQTPEEIVLRAKELGVQSVTLTDHGTLLGIPSFMDAGKKYGVNTVPGCEFYLESRAHFLVVAKDYKGYQSIARALRDAWKDQEQMKNKTWVPILSMATMKKHFSGNTHVIATTACVGNPVSRILLKNHRKQKEIEKLQTGLQMLQPEYEEWKSADEDYRHCLDRIDKLKKEAGEYKPYLSKKFRNQVEKAKEQMEQISFNEDMQFHAGDDVRAKEALIKNAEEMTAQINRELDQFTARRRQAKAAADKKKTKKEKYLALKTRIKEVSLFRETDLYEEAGQKLHELNSIFPFFYVELQYHGMEEEKLVMPLLAKLAEEQDIPVIAANDAHILDATEQSVRGRKVVRFNYFKKAEPVSPADRELYLKTGPELIQALTPVVGADTAKRAVGNTQILDECCVVFPADTHYPTISNGEAVFDRLVEEARQRMKDCGHWTARHEERYHYEIGIIKKMGYVDYHLVVRDFCFMARKLGVVPQSEIENIPFDFQKVDEWLKKKGFQVGVGVGPGRGSAVGSLICYLLGITNVDPLKYDLLFERFLNPERVSMPDIDSDIKRSLRPVIIQYIKWKYGNNAVCSIATEDCYAAKSALQMAARNLASERYGEDKRLTEQEKLEKNALAKLGYRISDLVTESELSKCEQKILETYPTEDARQILEDAYLIENRLSGTGIHAGGVIISDNQDVCDYVPLHWAEEKQVWVAQCDMVKAEESGLLKMDVLGLAMEDILSDCLHLVMNRYGTAIDLDRIETEPEVLRDIYGKGQTNSVFQFESDGMKQMLRKFQPESMEDLILLNACYRPGPMQYLEDIIRVKKTGKQKESCLTKIPQLKGILKTTYGYPVYQEQVMQIFQVLAGYSLGAADMVRRAMSKKKTEKLEIERKAFLYGDESRQITGCQKNGIDPALANELFDQLMEFSKYGFNKSHATVYAVVSYQAAWLKYHYPLEFSCAVLNNKEQSEYAKALEDCDVMGIRVLPPDINRSFYDFTIEGQSIRFGFKGVKGISDRATVGHFSVGNSQKVSPYQSFTDFLFRTRNGEGSFLDKRISEGLIKGGSFDIFLPDREKAFELYEDITKMKTPVREEIEKKEAYIKTSTSRCIQYNIEQEEAFLGIPVSADPLQKYPDDAACGCMPMNELQDGDGMVYGYVTESNITKTKTDKDIMILTVKGKKGKIPAFCMGKQFHEYRKKNWTGTVVRIKGSIKGQGIFVETVSYMTKKDVTYFLRVDSEAKAKAFLSAMDRHKGEPAANTLVMDISVGNPNGIYVPIRPRLQQMDVPEAVIEEVGAMQYKLS